MGDANVPGRKEEKEDGTLNMSALKESLSCYRCSLLTGYQMYLCTTVG